MKRRQDSADETEWSDVVSFMNQYGDGTVYNREFVRKAWPLMAMYDEANWVRKPGDDNGSAYAVQRLEAEKATVKMRDERNELARIQRELARRESMLDLIKEGLRAEVSPAVGYEPNEVETSDTDILVHLTDLHAGIEINNYFNTYNEDVLSQRLSKYLEKINEIRMRHGSENCYVMLGGDLCSGLIHSALRIENNLDIIKQVKFVSMAISQFVQQLSHMFRYVYIYSVPGNHSRVQPKKEDNLKGENFDILVPMILSLSLQEFRNVYIHDENIEESVAMFSVRGQKVFGVHGDKDTMENVVQKLTMVWGMKPDIVLIGHRHTNGLSTVYDTKVIQSGCIDGPDNYCMDKRLRNKPEQMVAVISDNGLECLYDVTLE